MLTMNNKLDPATVFSVGVDLQVLRFHVIETKPYMKIILPPLTMSLQSGGIHEQEL